MAFIIILFFYLLNYESLSISSSVLSEEYQLVKKPDVMEDAYDMVKDGIHVRTGLKASDGYMTVVNNCTNCHSAKLVIQNRMNEDRWRATIKWMQKTQNLWELGENEQIIIDYLVLNYPPELKGRRSNLDNVDWYVLE
ncbi:monoheme cytochrome C [Maribacter sp. 4U21]|uniref:monoheme cytochrome C n=1 Tax=Maribacter sp. 4U21 TaxID=1889779 RepID=UPI00211DEB6D|nr:monoheme cytochrome C [Maribacter sp. 4U21]